MRVAWIGNSYTFFNDLPTMLATLAALAPTPINVSHLQVTPGGSSLADHANLSKAAGLETKLMLEAARGWDYVVLQDQSETPGGGRDTDAGEAPGVARDKAEAALSKFYAPAIAAAKATPVLYSTWGRHDGDSVNADCGYGTFEGMTAKTTEGYEQYAAVLSKAAPAASPAPIIVPAGRAFELVYKSTDDPLSNTSLFSCLYHHSGTTVEDGGGGGGGCVLDGYGLGGHPSQLGTYLIACTFVAAVLGQSPVGISWAPDGVSDKQRDLLQQVALQAVKQL
tara:strand:- start:168 stop:1007 length:840 start_codon:yes stop_codon:yes gene_type:complete